MRGVHTRISDLRKGVFVEVAKIAYYSDNIYEDLEAIPYRLSPDENPKFRESVYRERAISSERARLAMGMELRPADKPVHITSGLKDVDVNEIYYQPPLMQVIPSACEACEDNVYKVTNMCRDCLAHACMEVCPKDAVSLKDGHAFIDQDKCIKCGKCKSNCPYDAIAKKMRPCALACGVKAIDNDQYDRAVINQDKCLACGMCMVNCPFGAIADKSQIYQLISCMKGKQDVIAEIAPAYVGQFGKNVSPDQIYEGLKQLGFAEVYEVALGADIGAISEMHDYVDNVVNGDLPFLLTSCCTAWAALAREQFPEIIDSVSKELTPMVATARSIKMEHPTAKVVFIGPCAAKKLEAIRTEVRSDVDFVITFEELDAMFTAKGIVLEELQPHGNLHDATGAGRGYAVSSGVATAITKSINTYFPDVEVKTEHVEGLAECKKMLQLAKAGKYNGYLIEGMGCPGGCVAGAGTLIPVQNARKEVLNLVKSSSKQVPDKDLYEIELK